MEQKKTLTASAESTEMKLRLKYTNVPTPKFSGKKRNASNSGRAGKAIRRQKRALVPGSASANRNKGKK